MTSIDDIMNLLDWNNSLDKQAKGIRLAREIKSIDVFLQPSGRMHNKNVWYNCAIILSERTDDELFPYLINLLEWLQDMNWPGAFCILERINKFIQNARFKRAVKECIDRALALNDETWFNNLLLIKGTCQGDCSLDTLKRT